LPHKKIPIFAGPRIIGYADPAHAERLARKRNVKAVRVRKTKEIARINITEVPTVNGKDHGFHEHSGDSNVSTYGQELFDGDTVGVIPGFRTIIQHKTCITLHWPEIAAEERTTVPVARRSEHVL
jgi:hypothetical protein